MRKLGAGAVQANRLVRVTMLRGGIPTPPRAMVRATVRATMCAATLAIAACGGSDATAPGVTHATLDAAAIGATASRLQAITSQPVIAAMLSQGAAAGLPSFARNVAQLPRLTPRLAPRLTPPLSGLVTSAARLTPFARSTNQRTTPPTDQRANVSLATPRLATHATLGDPTALIPDSLLGKTLVPDAQGAFSVNSSLTGAPPNGVRFIIRTLGSSQDLGYADLTEAVSGATDALTLDVKTTAGVPVMHNTESTTISGTNETDTFGGYVTNGTDRIDYTVNLLTTSTRTSATTSLTAANAGVAVADTAVLDGMTASDVHISHITVGPTVFRITTPAVVDSEFGGYTESDTSRVSVNGAPFATITTDASGTPSITAPDGSPLSTSDTSVLTSLEGILVSTGSVILAPVVVVVWLLIATNGY